jgi:FkbM family methyltransferase
MVRIIDNIKEFSLSLNKGINLFRSCRWTKNSSFSQEAEDLVLFEIAQFKNSYNGFYLDVGAHHPFRFSNTAIYYQRGWRGINIDATPESMNEFRKMRPDDINIECAVSSDTRERMFFVYNEPALNGIDCDRSEEFVGTKFKLLRKIPVQTHTLASILQSHIQQLPKPNFLTVDVEGHDLEVLQSNDWNKFRFDWVLCEIQVGSISDLAYNPVYKYLSDIGYHLRAFTGRTGIFQASV